MWSEDDGQSYSDYLEEKAETEGQEGMTDEEQHDYEVQHLEDELYKTQNEMDSPTGEDD